MSTNPEVLNTVENDQIVLSEEISFNLLAQEGNIDWFLCQHATTGETFVLATAGNEESVFHVTRLLKNEYGLRAKLSESWALQPQRFTLYQGRYALVYNPFNYNTLADKLCMPPDTVREFLSCAAKLCATLSMMHQHGLIHGDIKPANFFFTDEGEVRLGGFGLSSIQNDLLQQSSIPVSGGTLAYMSPEHTYRSSHPVDKISDLYSLGIVLYELLTGRLPYGNAEGGHAEWVHHHIASEALPPHMIRQDVPLVLSSIILRLLAKSPEYRYQTVEGVLADLRRCASTLRPDGIIEPFALGLQDLQPSTFAPAILFTEHPQAKEILSAFEEVSKSGKHSLVAISGVPGSGKSSLIASSLKLLRNQNALMTVVKADQHSPVLPYAVFTAAFRTLTLHVLGLPTEEMTCWKTHITCLLGKYVGLAVNLVPELGILLKQRAAVQTHAHSVDARDRLNLVACSLVKAFTAPGRPLVMLIDDVHWADQATLLLLQNLLTLSEDIPLLLVMTYRDSVSLPCPTIAANLNCIRAHAARITDITPAPLSEKNIADWLAGLFHSRHQEMAELAAIIHEKTDGNPLATHEFFRQAVREGLITHNAPFKWTYDSQALKNCHYTENVAASVLHHLSALPPATRVLLGKLASLGSAGELAVTGKIINASVKDIETTLLPAVTARLVSLNASGYAFLHDSMHEAALSLLDDEEKDGFHYAALHYYMRESSLDISNALLFRAAHHLLSVKNPSLLTPNARELCQLMVNAARRAKMTGDYVSALRYLKVTRLINSSAGNEESVEFLLEEAECEFLNGNLPAALTLCHTIQSLPGEITDKAETEVVY